ncbi:MAG: hypothetical protein P1U32_05250 [Legionellaceae bacterium]|nr:hypothetical protein [Legionellaceae bacterium]
MPTDDKKSSKTGGFMGLFRKRKADEASTPESEASNASAAIDKFASELEESLAGVETQSNMGAIIKELEGKIPKLGQYLQDPSLSQTSKDTLIALHQKLVEILPPLSKRDATLRQAIKKFIDAMGGTDEKVNIQFPSSLDFDGRVQFVNENLQTIDQYLALNTTDETLNPQLQIIKDKLQNEKAILDVHQQQVEAEKSSLQTKLQKTEAELEAARNKPSSAVPGGGLPKAPHPLFGGGGLPGSGAGGDDKAAFLAKIGAKGALGGLLGGLNATKLKKVEKDPIDVAIENAKKNGEDVFVAALEAAEKTGLSSVAAVGKAGQAAELSNIDIVQKMLSRLKEKEPDITEKNLIKQVTAIAKQIGFSEVTAGIMVKQAMIAERKAAGNYEEVTGARRDTPPPNEPKQESALEARLRQQRMKAELKEGNPKPGENSENEPPSNQVP